MMRTFFLTFCCWVALVLQGLGQTSEVLRKAPMPAEREGVISGRVLGEDGQPIPKAMIEIYSMVPKPGSVPAVPTDADGNFKLTGLPPAPYVLKTFFPGYVVDRRAPANEFYRINEHVTINLLKGGVITGQVTDGNGEPLVGVRVTPKFVRSLDGFPVREWRDDFRLSRLTDDRGVYRIYGLEPGVYLVSVNTKYEFLESLKTGLVSIFYPSATREGAGEISVRSGQEVTGIDIRHRADRGRFISGKVNDIFTLGETGDFNGTSVLAGGLAGGEDIMAARVAKSGGFELQGLSDGEYEIIALRDRGQEVSTAYSPPRRVTLSGADVSGIELKLEKTGSISGRVLIEATNLPETCDKVPPVSFDEILVGAKASQGANSNSNLMMLFRSRGGWNGGNIDRKGEFELTRLFAGDYRLVANLPGESWFLLSVTRAGSSQNAGRPLDISSNGIAVKSGESVTGVEVKIAGGAAYLHGKVVAAREDLKLPKRTTVHLIPAEISAANDFLRYAETIGSDDGAFEFKHLAPGRYWLIARPSGEKGLDHPLAWEAAERAKLRREAEEEKNEVTLRSCQRAEVLVKIMESEAGRK